jgi:hypothetical protein
MAAVLIAVAVVWLVLSVLATGACALVARAGQDENRRRLDADLIRLLESEMVAHVPPPPLLREIP